MNFIAIYNMKTKNIFSQVKPSSPKMINQMKEVCTTYEKMFLSEFKVKRVINTRTGWKIV